MATQSASAVPQLGELLRYWRQERGKSQLHLSLDTGISQPHPALVLDRYWNVIRTNQAAPRFFGSFINLEARPKPRNLLDLMFDPTGMRPFVEKWEKVAGGLLQRVRREAVGQVLDAKLQELLKRLRQYPGVAGLKIPLAPQSPVLPITFRRGEERLSYFSLITTVGTPQCITAQELRVECMFPTGVEEAAL